MLDTLYELFRKTSEPQIFGNIVMTVQQIVDCFSKEFKDDHDAKQAALDCLIKMFESHKSAAPVVADAPTT